MPIDAWITTAVLVTTLGALFSGRVGPAPAMLASTASLYVLGVTDSREAFGGFSANAPWVIAGLYVIAGVVQQTGAMAGQVARLMPKNGSARRSLARLLTPVGLISALVANTPVVATLVPAITRWTNARGKHPGPYLMPLSFATILGGTLTVIGSSTNVAASGLLATAGHESIAMFELFPVAAPAVIVGLIYLVMATPRMLRTSHDIADDAVADMYTGRFVVRDEGLVGDVTAASLRDQITGVESIERNGAELQDDQIVSSGDVVIVVGPAVALIAAREALASRPVQEMGQRYFEAVVAPGSSHKGSMLGETATSTHVFARRLDRHYTPGSPIARGETVLVCANPSSMRATSWTSEFSLAVRLDMPPSRPHLTKRVIPIAMATIVAASFDSIGILRAVICGVGALVLTGTVRPREALRFVNIEVVVLIGAALGIGAAVEQSGLASAIVDQIAAAAGSTEPVIGVVVLLAATVVMTEMLTNVAAVAILVPVALQLGPELAVDERQLALAVVVAASASFLTPFGYQTNTMVWRPGGYDITDFTRLGAPLTVLVLATLTAGVMI